MNRPEPAQLSDPHKGELCSVRRLEKAVISQLVPRRNLARVQPVLEVAFPASSVLLQTGCSALVVPSSSDVCGGGQLLGLFPRPFQANPKATSNIPILLSLGRVSFPRGQQLCHFRTWAGCAPTDLLVTPGSGVAPALRFGKPGSACLHIGVASAVPGRVPSDRLQLWAVCWCWDQKSALFPGCQTMAMLDKLRAAVQPDAVCGRMCDSVILGKIWSVCSSFGRSVVGTGQKRHGSLPTAGLSICRFPLVPQLQRCHSFLSGCCAGKDKQQPSALPWEVTLKAWGAWALLWGTAGRSWVWVGATVYVDVPGNGSSRRDVPACRLLWLGALSSGAFDYFAFLEIIILCGFFWG